MWLRLWLSCCRENVNSQNTTGYILHLTLLATLYIWTTKDGTKTFLACQLARFLQRYVKLLTLPDAAPVLRESDALVQQD